MKHGDFTGLASNYSRYRPGYSRSVSSLIASLLNKDPSSADAVDVGAGTGIWTRIVQQMGFRSVTAVEPNDDMRTHGIEDSIGSGIIWKNGSAESTGLSSDSNDLFTAAACLHWFDFDKTMAEIRRVLRSGGVFAALWNLRYIECNPLLVEIEDKLLQLVPNMTRVSSGNSEFTRRLADRLWTSNTFTDVVCLEGRHTAKLTPAHYIGVWRSVNDVQVQAGPEIFDKFIRFIEERTTHLEHIEATYLTRAWCGIRS